MASGLAARTAARGFPAPGYASDSAEAVAAAALASQGGWADPAHGEISYGPSPSTLHGFALEGPGDVTLDIAGDRPGPGEMHDPDQTPGYGPGTYRTHAAPVPGWAGSYHDFGALDELHQNSRSIHSVNFGGSLLQDYGPGQSPGGTELPMDPSGTEDYGYSNQPPLTGAQRVLGGKDAVQGYGGGGSGPGGVNGDGYGSVRANHKNVSGNVVNAYLDPAERPFIVPQAAGTFVPTDAVTGPEPFSSFIAADGNAYSDPSAYAAPPDPATLSQPLTSATAWGW
ncbi:hypothetical protein [Actinospica sp.]|uniref:hypothetical protein n=1 Tax=Actinospica sp. TaxID=1872142 RepID=UPI002C7B3542|nr:hypothetical protein [Actinospica sp.]HWG26103.1 hypothetical protein [Actinospica sp.]